MYRTTAELMAKLLKPPAVWRVEFTKRPNIWGGNWFLTIKHFSRFCLMIWSQSNHDMTLADARKYTYFIITWPYQMKISLGWIALQFDWHGKDAPNWIWYSLGDYALLFQTHIRPSFTFRKPIYLDDEKGHVK